ncbi:hypothetical protein CPT03_11455 [Pedobacter ginsengisoli]|uniref:Response regulatory domain-containing protein n=1 Tax=Pedobacter ginsengisoli TaxID=363852 RepID=A0A2D1U612_9SPHI|nr:hypothetical protein [Pedobacter ginsengisoli]ATP57049.1 hypothetical protein CPT03_11455 [Pedobacter ginsengisoli]
MHKILIQEADASIRDVLSLSLKADGFEGTLIKNCNEKLLNLVAFVRPYLLVLDFKLKGADNILICQ